MDRPQVKGMLFLKVLEQAERRWGAGARASIASNVPEPERWYPMGEFCDLLDSIMAGPGRSNPLSVYLIGLGTMKDDPQWQLAFAPMDPTDVFLSTERQDTLYRTGGQAATLVGPKHVRVDLEGGESCGKVWFEFYRGRLQGVLELTGRTGVVHLLPAKGGGGRQYDIKWG
jgi:hypothetical protein